jgi:hypothetical protein
MRQTYATHASLPKPFFLFLVPIFFGNLVVEAVRLWRGPSLGQAWELVVALGLLGAVSWARLTSMRVQDRVIIPESAARLKALLPSELAAKVDGLPRSQVIALRFASDAEVEPLVRRVLAGELATATATKKAIRDWRPDELPRV